MSEGGPRRSLPLADATTDAYWDAAREGRLLIQRCNACAHSYSYARPFCPKCWSADVTWVEASGSASLYTWSVVHSNDLPAFADWVPYVAAIVDLDEGPRMATILVDCDAESLHAGMPLAVEFFEPEPGGQPLPVFRPVAA
jgi:uncharacterized OB-fold protein